MRRALALVLLLSAAPAAASSAGRLGGGVILGVPFGATAKYWVDDRAAVQGAVGSFDGRLTATSDLLYHVEDWLPRKAPGRIPLYLGAGVRFRENRTDFWGVRFPVGACLYGKGGDLELFAEVGPVVRLSPGVDNTWDGAVGLRIYFPRR